MGSTNATFTPENLFRLDMLLVISLVFDRTDSLDNDNGSDDGDGLMGDYRLYPISD